MAAYAALVSLHTIIHTIQNHPNPPISLDYLQAESLVDKITFLQEFLEAYSQKEAYPMDGLESSIRDASYAAEEVIESYIMDRIGGCTSSRRDRFYRDLQNIIQQMEVFQKEAMGIKEKMGDDEGHRLSSKFDGSIVSSSAVQKTVMVGLDNVLIELLDKLTGQQSSRQIIPIVGMGGIGKTTLAIKAYDHALVAYHFHIRIWVTISQKFKTRDILLEILHQRNRDVKEDLSRMSEEQLGERIYKELFGAKYLIVMDDMWSSDAWDNIRRFFPENNNGSRIIITTRISDLVAQLTRSSGIQMNLLNEDDSWNLFCKYAFREDACTPNFEEIGKTITKNCKGLPLSIIVIGGLLAKSERTKQHWEYIARNLSSTVNLEDNERCLKILHLSYIHLPIHLKPCFLYMGAFREDEVIFVSWLVKLLVAEGFLKSVTNKNIRVVVREYIKELVDRNLLMVYMRGSTGSIKYCKIHDLVRDLCLRIIQKEKFLYVIGENNLEAYGGINTCRRLAYHRRVSIEEFLLSQPLPTISWIHEFEEVLPSFNCRLLRLSGINDGTKGFNTSKKAVLLANEVLYHPRYNIIFSPISLFWNLQILVVEIDSNPIDIWNMSQLRHARIRNILLPIPLYNDIVLSNLETLSYVNGFKCSGEIVQRIPNIRKLVILYHDSPGTEYSNCCLNNFERLHKLEHLECIFGRNKNRARQANLLENLTFPHSLKKLVLQGPGLLWEDVTAMIGSFPCLEKLKLSDIPGLEWRPSTEAQFLCLKFLEIKFCRKLESWTVDSTQFPLLEHLVLIDLDHLEEIPSDIGEIPTLQSIRLIQCSDSAVVSAKRIVEEQEELGNPGLAVDVFVTARSNHLKSLEGDNFRVTNSLPLHDPTYIRAHR